MLPRAPQAHLATSPGTRNSGSTMTGGLGCCDAETAAETDAEVVSDNTPTALRALVSKLPEPLVLAAAAPAAVVPAVLLLLLLEVLLVLLALLLLLLMMFVAPLAAAGGPDELVDVLLVAAAAAAGWAVARATVAACCAVAPCAAAAAAACCTTGGNHAGVPADAISAGGCSAASISRNWDANCVHQHQHTRAVSGH